MRYEHHSENIYVSRSLKAIADPDIPSRVKPLLALLQRLSRNGKRKVFARAAWIARQIGRAVSVYYEHRAILVELGLIGVTEKRNGYDRSAPSEIVVNTVREIATAFWKGSARRLKEAWREGAAERKARKSASPENRRQNGANINISSSKECCTRLKWAYPGLSRVDQRRSDERAALRERLGMTAEILASIPDAGVSGNG